MNVSEMMKSTTGDGDGLPGLCPDLEVGHVRRLLQLRQDRQCPELLELAHQRICDAPEVDFRTRLTNSLYVDGLLPN